MLSPILSIIILAEVLLGILVAYCFIKHEEKFVAFEDKIIFAMLKKIRSGKASKRSGR